MAELAKSQQEKNFQYWMSRLAHIKPNIEREARAGSNIEIETGKFYLGIMKEAAFEQYEAYIEVIPEGQQRILEMKKDFTSFADVQTWVASTLNKHEALVEQCLKL